MTQTVAPKKGRLFDTETDRLLNDRETWDYLKSSEELK
jgi:hypothetical protein